MHMKIYKYIFSPQLGCHVRVRKINWIWHILSYIKYTRFGKTNKCNIVFHRDIYSIFIEESIDCFQGDWSALRIQSAIYETRLFIVCIQFLHVWENATLGLEIFRGKVVHQPEACTSEDLSGGCHHQAACHTAVKPRDFLPRFPATTLPIPERVFDGAHQYIKISRHKVLDGHHTLLFLFFRNAKESDVVATGISLQVVRFRLEGGNGNSGLLGF